jgi:hypothetical protein
MGTSNFYNENASSIFVVLNTYIDDETGEEKTPDELDCQDFIDNTKEFINETVKEHNSKNKLKLIYNEDSGEDSHSLRSYSSESLGQINCYKNYLDIEIEVRITLILRSGYYQAGNLDWDIDFHVQRCYSNFDNIEDTIEEFKYRAEKDFCNKGIIEIQSKNLANYLTNTKDFLIEFVEKEIYEKLSESYKVYARFSNGEAWYEKKINK